MLFVSLTNRAAMTISNGYTAAGRMIEISGSGCSAMGTASFSNSAALRLAGAAGGGTGVGAEEDVVCATAPRNTGPTTVQQTNKAAANGLMGKNSLTPALNEPEDQRRRRGSRQTATVMCTHITNLPDTIQQRNCYF